MYSELCETETAHDIDIPCVEQDLRLNFLFVAASITANMSSLLAGAALDRFGRRLCWLTACVVLTIGSVLMGSSFAIPEFDGYLLGNVCLAMGGTFLFVPSFQLANAFPRYSGIIVALITGAFDASAAVFLFFRLVHEATDGVISLSMFFFGYVLVPVLILIAEIMYMPSRGYHTTLELDQKIEQARDDTRDLHDSDVDISDSGELTRVRSARQERRIARLDRIEDLAGDEDQRQERVRAEEDKYENSGVWGVLHGVPAYRQMMTPWFMLLLLLTLLQMLKMNYFIATVRDQYRYMLGSEDLAETINHFFDAALPIGGVATTPFIGLLLNNASVPTTFAVLTGFVIAIGVLNCLPYLWAGYATVIVFVAFRPLFYSAISDYATKVFGFATFGRIYGTLVCICGLLNLGQTGLDALTHGPLAGDATPVNIGLGVGGAISGLALTIFISTSARVYIEEKEEVEVGYERQRLLGEGTRQYGATE